MARTMTIRVKARPWSFWRTKPRSSSTAYTTLSARPAAANAPDAPFSAIRMLIASVIDTAPPAFSIAPLSDDWIASVTAGSAPLSRA